MSKKPSKVGASLKTVASVDATPTVQLHGGALLGWLRDEAAVRGHNTSELALSLGVTYGYLHQLRSGHRQIRHISDEFAQSCARYLGVPAIAVKFLAGRITTADFIPPAESEAEAVERAFRQMLQDPEARTLLPADASKLPLDVKRAFVLLHARVTGKDPLCAVELPVMLKSLQRAVIADAATVADSEAEDLLRESTCSE